MAKRIILSGGEYSGQVGWSERGSLTMLIVKRHKFVDIQFNIALIGVGCDLQGFARIHKAG
jgi:hypothetical protein